MGDERRKFSIPFEGKVLAACLKYLVGTPLQTAAYARAHTPFYRALYGGGKLRDFTSLPVLKKEMVRDASPYDLLSDELAGKVRYYGETTGSAGSPTPSFYTRGEFRGSTLLSWMTPYVSWLRKVIRERRTCVNGITFGFTIAGMSFGELMADNGALVANVGSRSTIATPERTAGAIARLLPSVVCGTPIDFLCWMRIVREDYPDRYLQVLAHLKALVSTAELCSASRRAQVEREFGIVVVNTYACVEGFFALPCPCGESHVVDAYHVEVFDEELRRGEEFGKGRFAFTNLLRKSTPYVRYLLDDLVTVTRSACPYGFRKSIHPHGRYELAVRLNGALCDVDDFEELLFRFGLWGDYQVAIEEEGMKVTVERYADGAEISRIASELQERFGVPAEVRFVDFGTLTAYREVRKAKPILKVRDLRASSTQDVPDVV